MGRENHGIVALSSTIALLRERFKKLERVREMREARELHRSLTGRGGGQVISLQSPEQPKWLFLGAPPSRSGHVVDTSLTVGSWHRSNGPMSGETDVDTSLHL